MDAALQPWLDKYPAKMRVLGDSANYGVLKGIVAMTSAAKGPYFLFLERDFHVRAWRTRVWLLRGVLLVFRSQPAVLTTSPPPDAAHRARDVRVRAAFCWGRYARRRRR